MSTPPFTLHAVTMTVPEALRRRTGRQNVQTLSRLARLALAHSCRKSGLRLETFPKDGRGVPLPVDGVYWSVSHKRSVVGGLAAPLPVGIDLETIRPVSAGVMAKVADAREWQLVRGSRQRGFFRLWTAKEAVLKAVGTGIAGLSRCRVKAIVDETHMLLTYDGAVWPVVHHWFDDHAAAVTSHHFEVDWTMMPM